MDIRNIPLLLKRAGTEYGTRPATGYAGEEMISYKTLLDRVNALAGALIAFGV